MHPVAHIITTMGTAALGNLVFMMGKNKVAAAAVNIDGFTQVSANHGGALQVPARTAAAPGAVPAGIFICGRLPQDKIPGMTLVVSHLHPCPRQHVVQ